MFSLQGKVTLVTGAASGIGFAIAEAFAAAGAFVYVADRDEKGAQAQADNILGAKGRCAAMSLDVTVKEQCLEAAARVVREHGHLDILVNNAGIGAVGTLLTTSEEDMDRMYNVNVRGVFNVSKAFLPKMIERSAGNIINMASIGGVMAVRERLAYCATKFAVVGLTKAIALDHAAQGIRANCICPARVETPFVKARIAEYPDPEAAYREMSSSQLLGRMVRPEEVAASAVYLASDESYMVTGTAFLIDCGWSAGK